MAREEEDILFVIWFYRIEARKIEFLVCREREEEKETVKTRLSEKGKLVIIDRFASTPRGRDLDTMSIATSVPIWRQAAIPPIARKWNDVSKETSKRLNKDTVDSPESRRRQLSFPDFLNLSPAPVLSRSFPSIILILHE